MGTNRKTDRWKGRRTDRQTNIQLKTENRLKYQYGAGEKSKNNKNTHVKQDRTQAVRYADKQGNLSVCRQILLPDLQTDS